MADQETQNQNQDPDYEEPSLTDLEDVSGGHVCVQGTIIVKPDDEVSTE